MNFGAIPFRSGVRLFVPGRRAGGLWILGLIFLLGAFSPLAPPALAAPVLDGNIDDVIAQANAFIQNETGCGIIINDPAKEICLTDNAIVPCTNNLSTCTAAGNLPYFANGFDQILIVSAVQGTDAWWGIRTTGQIGDTDGDGTDGKGPCANGPQDPPGIGPGEGYEWDIDTDCDAFTDIIITVSGGSGTHQPSVIVTDGAGNPIPGVTGQAQYGTTDLEVHTTGLVLPPAFELSSFVSSQRDGLSEDGSSPYKCNLPHVTLSIQKTVDKPSICAGDKDRFTVTVANNSVVDVVTSVRDVLPPGWTYANNVSGDYAFNSQNGQVVSFGPLSTPAGQSRSVSFDATSPGDCLGSYENKAVAEGVFAITCLPEPATALTDTARATVTCGSNPCVTIQCAPEDTTVELGSPYSVRATAVNCSTAPEDITITLNGQTFSFPAVAASASVTAIITQNCDSPGTATYSASATATSGCSTTAPVTCQSRVTCQDGVCCWLTMGGFLNANMRQGNKDNTFGGNVGPPPSGSWEHIQRNGKDEVFNFHSHDAHVIGCSNDGNAGPCHPAGDANVIDFAGTGAYSLNGGARTGQATFTAHVEDHGEPGGQGHTGGCGTPDFYRITVLDATTQEVVFTAEGYLDGGNAQIHDCKHATQAPTVVRRGGGTLSTNGSGDGTSTDVNATGSGVSVLELYRPTPNPFSNTTSFAYQVSGSASERVQIGIYNVAGRLIRELVNETKAPGRYETVWNGQDQDGSSVTHGVYFIRAFIGGVRVDAASRILYLR